MNSNNAYQKGGKSFYAVLSIALVSVVAAAVVITYTSSRLNSKKNEPSQQSDTGLVSSPIESENVITPKDDVPDTRDEETTEETSVKEETTSQKSQTTETGKKDTAETTKKSISCCLPVGTDILKDYSNGTMVKSKTMNDWRLHNGVDFTGEIGDEVHAVCDGKVTKISTDSMWGKTVEIDHGNGMVAKYCGFEEINVKENDEVKKEQTIGTLGTIPIESADNTHLHLEITLNGKITDPIAALGKETVSE